MIPDRESLTVEFKSDVDRLPDAELTAAVICLANTEGGELYVGVENDGTITGLHAAHQNVAGLVAMIANRTIPPLSVRVEPINVNGRRVAKVIVPKSHQLVATSEGLLQRRRLALLKTHADLLPKVEKTFEVAEMTRRELLTELVPRIEDFETQGYGLMFQSPYLARVTDIPWMIEKLRENPAATIANQWVRLIERLFDPSVKGLLDKVLAACEWCAVLREAFDDRFAPISVASVKATELRERYAQHLQWESEREDHNNPWKSS